MVKNKYKISKNVNTISEKKNEDFDLNINQLICNDSFLIAISTFVDFIKFISIEMEGVKRKIINPIYEIIKHNQEQISLVCKKVIECYFILKFYDMLGKKQFIVVDYLPKYFLENIITNSIENSIQLYFDHQSKESILEIIEKCIASNIVKTNKTLLKQAINNFQSGQYEIAIVGLTTVIDGALTNASSNCSTSLTKRMDSLVGKLDLECILNNKNIPVPALIITLQGCVEEFSSYHDFSEIEPESLNRHWISHGRSYRTKSETHCIKLIYILYGIVLINELIQKGALNIE